MSLRTDITNYQVGPCPDGFDMTCTDSDMVTQEQTSLSESMQALGCDPAVAVKCCSGDCPEEEEDDDYDPWAGKFDIALIYLIQSLLASFLHLRGIYIIY